MPAAALRSAAEAEQSGARQMAQDEGVGWQRYAASTDLGGGAAAGVLQEGWRQETGAKGGGCLASFVRLGEAGTPPLRVGWGRKGRRSDQQ